MTTDRFGLDVATSTRVRRVGSTSRTRRKRHGGERWPWTCSRLRYVTGFAVLSLEAIFNLGTLGRNDTSATAISDLFRGGIPRTSLSSKVSTCQNC